jgi:cytochrome c biogenesis protein
LSNGIVQSSSSLTGATTSAKGSKRGKGAKGAAARPGSSERAAAAPVVDDSPVLEAQDVLDAPALNAIDNTVEASKSEPKMKKAKSSGLSSAIDGFLNLISSVPFGIILLVLLIIACMIGMLIQQKELESFAAYYAELTPSEKLVYGNLGFFDIYHAWYFNLLLLLLSLNIILASIDHFPAAWSHFRRKKLTASPVFAMAQRFKDQVELPNLERQQLVERAAAAARALKFKVRITDKDDRTTVFAERGVWNRLGAYAVHVGLLTIFFGGFMTSRGFTGSVFITPEELSDKIKMNVFNVENATTEYAVTTRDIQLPFTLEGLDFAHKPIKKEGSISSSNTLDWLTWVRIHDTANGKTTDALIHMNKPYDYEGYRFFQANYIPYGSARSIKLSVTPATGGAAQELTIPRNGSATLADGTKVKYADFNPAFSVNSQGEPEAPRLPAEDYVNPAARLIYVKANGEEKSLWAFTPDFLKQIAGAPFLRSKLLDSGPYQFALTDFEKVPVSSGLQIQYDPGAKIVYVGFGILCLTLVLVFFFSHQRLWIVIEDGKVFLGGDANRNRLGFEDRAKKVTALIREPKTAN